MIRPVMCMCLDVTMEINNTIAVFDWENGGALGAHPVKIQHLFMSLPPTPIIPSRQFVAIL